jgi:hypothetical protein
MTLSVAPTSKSPEPTALGHLVQIPASSIKCIFFEHTLHVGPSCSSTQPLDEQFAPEPQHGFGSPSFQSLRHSRISSLSAVRRQKFWLIATSRRPTFNPHVTPSPSTSEQRSHFALVLLVAFSKPKGAK